MAEKEPEKKASKEAGHTIIQFESEEFYRAVVNQILYIADIQVAASAKNKMEAGKLVQQIEKGEIKPTLAIIDTMLESNHTEGRVIATKLKQLVPDIKIIAYTIVEYEPPKDDITLEWQEELKWADYVAIKSNRVPAQTIAKGLSELLGIDLDEKAKDPEYN